MSGILQSYNGLIRFYDGTIIAIESQEYSSDGKFNWEETFNPYDHISTLDGVTPLLGHRYKRVKHSGDTNFQLPYRIIPEEPIFRVQDNILQYKLETESDSQYKDLLDLDTLKGLDGAKGEQGIPGTGWYIDQVGYYKLRPDCGSNLLSTGCQTCNKGDGISSEFYTFLSLGDGVLVLDSTLISAGTITIDTVAFTHFSNDLVTWIPLTGGVVDFKVRYLATSSTGAVYIDMRNKNYYSSRGNVYVCAEGSWTLLTNVATPTYQLKERSGSTNIGFLNQFVDDVNTTLSSSIGIKSGKLEVINNSINEIAFASDTFADGINQVINTKPSIKPEDFVGFGLTTYTSTNDSLKDIQVLVDGLLGDGLAIQNGISVDGETNHLAKVDLTDLINNNSGLITTVEVDTFRDLKVNLGNGLHFDAASPVKIEVLVDDLSLLVDSSNVRVKPYTTSGDGIRRIHLNPDVIWTNRGLGFDTANGLYARIDTLAGTIGYNGSGELNVPFNGITGDRLNDNTADNTKGIEVNNDKLTIKVDGATIDFNGSGELEYIGNAGQFVSSITAGGTTLRDDIIYTVTSTTGSIDHSLVGTVNVGSDTMVLNLGVDEAWLSGYLTAHPELAGGAVWGAITGTVTAQTDLVSYITGRLTNYTILNTWYTNAQLNSTHGLVLKSVGGTTYKVIVDDQGNLDTQAVTL